MRQRKEGGSDSRLDEGGQDPGSNVAASPGGAQGISSQPIVIEMQEPSAPPLASAMSVPPLLEVNDSVLSPATPQSAGIGTLLFGQP